MHTDSMVFLVYLIEPSFCEFTENLRRSIFFFFPQALIYLANKRKKIRRNLEQNERIIQRELIREKFAFSRILTKVRGGESGRKVLKYEVDKTAIVLDFDCKYESFRLFVFTHISNASFFLKQRMSQDDYPDNDD